MWKSEENCYFRSVGESPSCPWLALELNLFALTGTTMYSESEEGADSPSLAPGVGGSAPGMFKLSTALPSFVCGRLNSVANGDFCPSAFAGVNVFSPMLGRSRGLDLPFETGDDLPLRDDVVGAEGERPAFLRRSSVALRRASRASSSEV